MGDILIEPAQNAASGAMRLPTLEPIPFNKPCLVGNELRYVAEAVANGHTSGNGPFTGRVEALLERRLAAGRVLLTTSCTAALEMAAMICRLGPGDEVILPSYTFVSTANAVVLRGATPVFVDIRADTLNIDERLIEAAVTPRTRAIFVVHYAGQSCEMDAIMDIATRHGLIVVEDAAQALYATYKGRWLGTIGHLGCYSFHETKNISCGEGGALVVNDPAMVERAEVLRDKGTNRRAFRAGTVAKYTWVDIGSSYTLSDLLAAYLLGQLEKSERIYESRRALFSLYCDLLHPLAVAGHIELPQSTAQTQRNHHIFYVMTRNEGERAALISHLESSGISAVFHYVPLHSSDFFRAEGAIELPVTDWASRCLLRLPLFIELTAQDVRRIAAAVHDFYGVTFVDPTPGGAPLPPESRVADAGVP